MAVYCQVLHDGQSAGPEYPVVPLYEGQADAELLDIKEASAQEKGWTTERADTAHLHAWKEYAANAGNPDEPDLVDRWFEIRG